MSKFGDLIDVEVPVLFDFFSEWDDVSNAMHDVLRDVAAALGGKAKVIKIEMEKFNGYLRFFTGENAESTFESEAIEGSDTIP